MKYTFFVSCLVLCNQMVHTCEDVKQQYLEKKEEDFKIKQQSIDQAGQLPPRMLDQKTLALKMAAQKKSHQEKERDQRAKMQKTKSEDARQQLHSGKKQKNVRFQDQRTISDDVDALTKSLRLLRIRGHVQDVTNKAGKSEVKVDHEQKLQNNNVYDVLQDLDGPLQF